MVALPQASATVNGYLASGDWSAFNAKEPAISLGTSLQYWRGDKTWQTLNPAAVGALSPTGNGSGLTNLQWSQIGNTPTALAGYGITNGALNTTTVNGHPLSSNVTVSASDVGLGNVLNVAQEPAISLGSSLQYWRGDKTWQTLNPAAVGAAPATSGTAILKGNNSGGFANAAAGTDYQSPLTFSQSIANSSGTVTLSGDSSSPGNSMLYGTNGSGIKGWYSQPSGGSGMTYPGAGVPNSTGSAWGTSYTVGTAANDLVQLNSSAQLPAVSAANLTNFPTFNQSTTGTAAGLSGSQTANYFYAAPNGSAGTASFRAMVAADVPTLNQNTTGSAATWTTARTLAGNSVNGSSNVAFANKFLVQGTSDSGLSAAQFLGSLGTGLLKNTTSTGVLSIAVSGTDFQSPLTFSQSVVNSSGAIALSGDSSSPGDSYYYGTNSSGTKGFFSLPSGGGMTYPGAGVPNSTGSAWGSSYTVGTAANDLVQLNSSGQLPAVSAVNLTNFPTFNQSTTGTAAGLSGSQTANYFYAAPNGTSGAAVWRAIVAADIPALNYQSPLTFTGGSVVNSSGSIALSGDSSSPGNSMLYGTNGSGIKGWYSQPSGGSGMTYPGAGVPLCTGSAWGTSYAVGTSANDLVQLNSSGQLPAVSGANLTNLTAAMVGAAPATTGTSILKGNGSGGTTAAVSNTDYAAVRDNGDPTYLWNGNYLLSRISDVWASITGGNLIVWGSNIYGTNLATVISTIGSSTPANLIVPPGTFAISANATVTPNIRLLPHNGAIISIPTGVTLTLNGPFEAGNYQVFALTGTGIVVPGPAMRGKLNACWWGADPTGATDSSAAINQMTASVRHGAAGTLSDYVYAGFYLPGGGSYLINTALNFAGLGSFSFYTDPAFSATLNLQTNNTPGIDFTGVIQATIRNFYIHGVDSTAASSCAILQKRMVNFGNSGNVWLYDVNIDGYFKVCNIMNIGQEVSGYQNVVCRISADSGKSIAPICNLYMGGMDKTSPGIPSPYVTAESTNQGCDDVDINGCQFSSGDATTLHNIIFVVNVANIKVSNSYLYNYGLSAIKFYQYTGASAAGFQEFGVTFDNTHIEGTQSTATFWAYSDDNGRIGAAPIIKDSGGQTAPIGLYFQNISAVTQYLNIDGLPCSGLAFKADGDIDCAHMQRLGFPGQNNLAVNIAGALQHSTLILDTLQGYSIGVVNDCLIYSIPNGVGSGTLMVPGTLTWNNEGYGLNSVTWGRSVPTAGNYNQADIVLNNSGSGPTGWLCRSEGTFGTLSGMTGAITIGTNSLVVNSLTGITVGNYIHVAGAGYFTVQGINSSTLTVYLDGNASATVSGAAVTYNGPPVFIPFGPTGGATTARPTLGASDVGYCYYDTTTSHLVVWSGSAWVAP